MIYTAAERMKEKEQISEGKRERENVSRQNEE